MKKLRLTEYLRCFKGLLVLILLTMICTFAPDRAMAHRVTIFAWVEGNKIFTESKFSGGKRVKGGEVTVYDLTGKQLLEGKTDDRGEFSFTIPERTAMKIVIQAGTGHRGEWTIPVDEIEGVVGPGPETTTHGETASKRSEKKLETSGLNLDEIRQTVEQALDQRLKPILKVLVESRESGPTVRDVFGGIGYIVGLMGIAAYFHYRRKSTKDNAKKRE